LISRSANRRYGAGLPLPSDCLETNIQKTSGLQLHPFLNTVHTKSRLFFGETIFVLERGKIVKTGSHDEPVAQKGLYYAMWRQQIGARTMDMTGTVG
jgi:ATP-binding cassette, subfamily B, bacterial